MGGPKAIQGNYSGARKKESKMTNSTIQYSPNPTFEGNIAMQLTSNSFKDGTGDQIAWIQKSLPRLPVFIIRGILEAALAFAQP